MKPLAYCVTLSLSDLLGEAKRLGIPVGILVDYDDDLTTTPQEVFVCPGSARILAEMGIRWFPGKPIFDRGLLKDKCCMICGHPLLNDDDVVVVVVDDSAYPSTPELN